tara:strand:- start:3827 stop:6109 length:2283 start_codon:yes stop_codon:yes gene_type:complete
LTSAVIALTPAAQAETFQIEEITVTAQKRAQSIQDVPISIAAIDGNFAVKNNVFELKDISGMIPNMQVAASPFQPIIKIRGLGASGGNKGFEESVSMFIDGVYSGRAKQFLAPFFDMERIEVIRGPQSAMFGKNATAGAISITSRKPSEELEGYVSGGYEFEYDGYNLEAAVSGALTDKILARIAGRVVREGGYLDNPVTGEDEPEVDSKVGRGYFIFNLTDNLSADLKIEYAERKVEGSDRQLVCGNGAPTYSFPTAGPGLGAFGTVECALDETVTSGAVAGPLAGVFPDQDFSDTETLNAMLAIDYTLGEHALKMVSGYAEFDEADQAPADFSGIGLETWTSEGNFKQFSQEIRLESPVGETFEYIVGLYYLKQEQALDNALNIVQAPPTLGYATRWRIDQDTEMWSVFGQLVWNVSDDLRLALSGRYNDETKDYVADIRNTVGGGALAVDAQTDITTLTVFNPIDETRSDKSFDPTINLQYDLTDDVMLFATWTQASKTGGFDFFPVYAAPVAKTAASLEYEDEEAENFELGMKAKLLDGRAIFNLTVFHTDYKNLQYVAFNAPLVGFEVKNIPSHSMDGLEIETQFQVNEYLLVGGNFAYLDTEYGDFPGVECPQILQVDNNGVCEAPGDTQNLRGQPLPYASKITANMFGQVDYPVANGYEVSLRLDAQYTDSFDPDLDRDPFLRIDSYWKFDARVGLSSLDNGWELSLQVKNLTDEDIISYGTDAGFPADPANPVYVQAKGPGRQVFLQARMDF